MGTSVDRACRWSGWEVARGGTSQVGLPDFGLRRWAGAIICQDGDVTEEQVGVEAPVSVLDVPGHEVEMSHGRGVGHRGDAQGGATVAA